MPQISLRAGQFTESVIRRMTRVSDSVGAINLSQGFPDFDPPKALLEALAMVSFSGPHQYEITYGAAGFRCALAEKQGAAIGLEIDPETQILVTCGATEAMVCAMLAVINPGDKVAVFSPFYENYGADAIIAGAEAVFVPLHAPDWQVDWEALEAAFTAGAKALVVCNPSNPTGKVFTRQELMRIGHMAKEHNAWVITDEVYEHIVYAPYTHTRLSALPGMWGHCLTVSSLSKTYSITGWRLGYLIGPEEALDAARKVHDFLTVGAAAPLQAAALPGLRAGPDYYEGLRALYAAKREQFLSGLDGIGLEHTVPQGSYFVLADMSRFMDKPPFRGLDDLAFCERLTRHIGVAAVPGSSFYPDAEKTGLIRLHFARSEESLKEAISRLGRLSE
ncbi:MAG: aminotransferase class I/II-fold pyridoxal phosphate-dependent enzyme [Eubacteriales bacterium]|nr:aminotransferase class I/II-fold pyridoxal phosphate-dependent enzyme [Eubacteriales bacterium]MDD4135061.1 aminotransferase class I/II-fold pyridoxal phosphate-dependent enzyme [Eubacteriales bacterium]